MSRLLIFGLGYTAQCLASHLRTQGGWQIVGTTRDGRGDSLRFDDAAAVQDAIASSSHILCSIPPLASLDSSSSAAGSAGGAGSADSAEGSADSESDPTLRSYGAALRDCGARWLGYLSSTGVYGDFGGAWVDESTQLRGRRTARIAADRAWQALRGDVRIFRLPAIYGPQRNILERVRAGRAYRIADMPEQIFSRIYVDDIVSAIVASFTSGAAGVYNIADDLPCDQNRVVEHACHLLRVEPPPALPFAEVGLSPAARSFYRENRRIANGKAKRLLGWKPNFPTYREGNSALLAHL